MLCSTPLPGLAGRLLMAGCCRPGFDLSGHFALTQGVQVMIRELMQEGGKAPYCRGGCMRSRVQFWCAGDLSGTAGALGWV